MSEIIRENVLNINMQYTVAGFKVINPRKTDKNGGVTWYGQIRLLDETGRMIRDRRLMNLLSEPRSLPYSQLDALAQSAHGVNYLGLAEQQRLGIYGNALASAIVVELSGQIGISDSDLQILAAAIVTAIAEEAYA